MAILSKTGITTGQSVEAWHVTQSIDAFSGLAEYDITLSGSLTLQNGTQQNGAFAVSDANGLITFTGSYSDLTNTSDAFNNFTSSYNTGSFTGSFSGDGSGLTGVTASFAPNFANTDLTFNESRLHNINGNILNITSDNGAYDESYFYLTPSLIYIGQNNFSFDLFGSQSRQIQLDGFSRMEMDLNSTTINNSGIDIDFRIEGENNQNLFFLDASTDRIGIGKNTPNTTLDISGSALITGSLTATQGLTGSLDTSFVKFNVSPFGYRETISNIGTTTTTATWSPIGVVTAASERVTHVEVSIIGRKLNSPMSGSYSKLSATFLNSGSLTQIGTTTRIVDHNGIPGTDTRIVASGGSISIQAFGLAGESITWYAFIDKYDLI
jgi:hypothetical protein